MNRIGILLLIVLVWSCGGSGEDAPTPLGNGLIDRLMQTYRIKDTVGLSDVVVSEKEDYHYLVGKKSGKFWLAQYDKDTKEELYSFVDTEGKFKFTETVDVGFGEKVEYKVDLNPMAVLVDKNVVGISFCANNTNDNKQRFVYCFIDNKVIEKNISVMKCTDVRIWYKESILFYTSKESGIKDTDSRLDYAYLYYRNNDNEYIIYEYNVPINNHYELKTVLPISLFEYIYNDETGTINRRCISPVHTIWSTQVKTYSQEAKYEFKLLDNTTENWKYKASVILFDGTKDDFEFTIDINTGVIQ